MHRAIKVKPMNNLLLLVKFDTNEEKVFNCFSLLDNKLYSRLTDTNYFKTVHIDDMGVVCWDDATDINPYELYEQSESISDFAFVG